MDSWLTDSVKNLLFKTCMEIAERVGHRLDNRIAMGQSIDERALTEDLVDSLDTQSTVNAWGTTIHSLQDEGIYLNANVRKSTKEHETGTDVGITINRRIHQAGVQSEAR